MVNEIITGISQAIFSEFGDSCKIYDENVKQGFKEPCFFIAQISSSESQRLGSRYHRPSLWDIHYFPKNGRAEAREVGERLLCALEYIELPDGPVRGTKMEYRLEDDVLHFFVNYDLFIYKVTEPDENMDDLEITTDLE